MVAGGACPAPTTKRANAIKFYAAPIKNVRAGRALHNFYLLSLIFYLKNPLFSTSENRVFYSSTSFTSGSPSTNARAFSIVVMAMLCSAVRVKNA